MKSWGEAESQCPVPRYSHWGPSRDVPGTQSAPWPGTSTSGAAGPGGHGHAPRVGQVVGHQGGPDLLVVTTLL